jgi:hypothetical protein
MQDKRDKEKDHQVDPLSFFRGLGYTLVGEVIAGTIILVIIFLVLKGC